MPKKQIIKIPQVKNDSSEEDPIELTTVQLLDKSMDKLKKEKVIKLNELKIKQIEEYNKLQEYYDDEINHLDCCKYRDYDPEIRSWTS